MNYLDPERLDRLAREYVLGTLTGRARRRFERVLQQAPAAWPAVHAWQRRFSVLAAGVPAMQPRDAVWRRLERRLFDPAARAPWWRGLWSPRTWTGALAGVLLCVFLLRLQPGLIGLEPASQALPQSYVGLLLDASGQPTLLASSLRHGRQLTVKVLQPVSVPPGRVARLWALPKNAPPFAVAVLPPLPAKGSVALALPDSSEKLFFDVPRLAVSIEPAAAVAPTAPAGDFLLSGHCVKLW